MEGPTQTPSNPQLEPRPKVAAETNQGPQSPQLPQIIINVGVGRLARLLCWIGWAGFILSALLLIGRSLASNDYFSNTADVDEKYHSGSKTGKNKVAIISVSGTILDGSFVKQQIDRARQDDKVKAIVLRVASPGGTITGSDYIYHHLTKLRQERDQLPLVVSMGSVAASGGYYVAMAVGDQQEAIFAEPTTWTGSIGVLIPHYDVSGLMARFDVKDDTLATHPRKQLMSMTRPISDDDRQLLQGYLNDAFARFKTVIREGRPTFRKAPAVLDKLATGEIFTANQALQHGLIDKIGFLEDAIERAMQLANLDEDETCVVEYRRLSSLLPIPFLSEGRASEQELGRLLDMSTPQAFYLASTFPALLTTWRTATDDK